MRSLLGRFHRPMSRGAMGDMLTMNSLGDGSTLSLDFTTMGGVLDPRLTFTRASTVATYINSSGYVATATTNEPRFDYSPTTIGEPKGLLIEGQTQNALFYSQDVTQATRWTIQGGIPISYTSVSATGGTAPDNTNTANLCTESTANNSRAIYQASTAAAGTYTASVWVKAGTGSTRYIRLVISSAAGNFVYVTVNISTGAVTQAAAAVGTASAASATVTSYRGSWYRIGLTGTLAAAPNVFIVPLGSAAPSVPTGDYGREAYLGNGSTFLIWGAQLELGSGASSYIPTGASQVTRNADNCSMYDNTSSGSLSWLKNATQGTIVVESYKRFSGTSFAGALFGTEATSTKDFMLYQAIGTNWMSFNWGASEYTTNYTAVSSPFFLKAAVSFSPGSPTTKADSLVSINGSNSSLNTTPNIALPFSTNIFCVGSHALASGLVPSKNYADAAIRSIKFYPTASTAAQLNALTAI